MKIIECVPNFSEGKNKKTINKIVESISKIKNIKVLDVRSDKDHNRTVVTFIGNPKDVIKAAFEGTKTASKLIDLNKHKGIHPRIGATDVLPLIPLKNITIKECVLYAKKLGKDIADKLKIPVYFYEKAATSPNRKNLSSIRNIGYEKIKTEIQKNKNLKPDFGPSKIGKAGAVMIGIRNILIAYNINLDTNNLKIAKEIASKIREKNGGLKYVKALGLKLKSKNIVQVSMNLTNYKKTDIADAYKAVGKEAKKHKVKIKENEIIGLIPKSSAEKAEKAGIKLTRYKSMKFIPLAEF